VFCCCSSLLFSFLCISVWLGRSAGTQQGGQKGKAQRAQEGGGERGGTLRLLHSGARGRPVPRAAGALCSSVRGSNIGALLTDRACFSLMQQATFLVPQRTVSHLARSPTALAAFLAPTAARRAVCCFFWRASAAVCPCAAMQVAKQLLSYKTSPNALRLGTDTRSAGRNSEDWCCNCRMSLPHVAANASGGRARRILRCGGCLWPSLLSLRIRCTPPCADCMCYSVACVRSWPS
jgi:hypothetical protein